MSTPFIIVGRDETTSYTLLDVSPAPANETQLDTLLDELATEANEAFANVSVVWADDSTAAVEQLVATLGEQHGESDYALTPAASGAPCELPRTMSLRGRAGSADRATVYQVDAIRGPGRGSFEVTGPCDDHTTEIRNRVRSSLNTHGFGWPQDRIAVRLTRNEYGNRYDSPTGLDLAIGCTVLAVAGRLPVECLEGASLVGELGPHVVLRVPRDLRASVRALAEDGATSVIVPEAAVDEATGLGIQVIGTTSLYGALEILAAHVHHPKICVHCTGGWIRAPHRPCTDRSPCANCRADDEPDHFHA
ncbi:magnesium chelatase domain-containing protein [Embleya sp. AB8]|uniref:magnesium chelatase domain-containing protein n=1 Tax=Embleya sp. AB8 TaxID=3156304 RepID=UPI003C77CF74